MEQRPARIPTQPSGVTGNKSLPKNRIDELADDLGPREIRELMKRDGKEKERENREFMERLRRKLERREQAEIGIDGPV